MSTTENQYNDAWHLSQIRRLGPLLSAWFALECSWRASRFADREFARATLLTVQDFLLGRSTLFEVDGVRDHVDARIWSTPRSEILHRKSLSAIRAATFPDSVVQHFYASQYARRLDGRSVKPLTRGVTEAALQRQRLEVFATYAECVPIQDLAHAYEKSRDLALLGMFSDAMQDEGFTPPLRATIV